MFLRCFVYSPFITSNFGKCIISIDDAYVLHFIRDSPEDILTLSPVSVLENSQENVPEWPTAAAEIFTRIMTC